MSGSLRAYAMPALAGALIAFLVRLIFGDLQIALIGMVVYTVVLGVLVVLAKALKWQEAPLAYAAISAIAVTVAFLLSHSS
ncbi:hypothetical protein [Aurantiacibacter aquimixticola]|uniref:DUF3649 domain-containing protein n=1 Tax=Aurantiacibacter aquimixticola TaxID=1958945 RepID=A0A419RVZ1_9SPHN|nr:hypothetical protein [Aurantiacibacter aquimixticola]RJY09970.1 hypothetical protein D6201_11980 [Aurantiacibacter aquimixticola]